MESTESPRNIRNIAFFQEGRTHYVIQEKIKYLNNNLRIISHQVIDGAGKFITNARNIGEARRKISG